VESLTRCAQAGLVNSRSKARVRGTILFIVSLPEVYF
jgi:hypothetical protein